MSGLYLHFPFCELKCPYCDFFSKKATEQDHKQWLRLIKQEIQHRCAPQTRFGTVYFGGGTPSLLAPDLFSELMEFLHAYLDLSNLKESTLEANPSSLDHDRLKVYSYWKLNRISIGVQSFQDVFLKTLGRIHNSEQAQRGVSDAIDLGFSVSIDLMFGLPGQQNHSWMEDIETALTFPLSHLSLYGLTIETGTPFFVWQKKKTLPPVNGESYDTLYLNAASKLQEAGLKRYEVSSFAKPERESLHNRKYWNHTEYLGIGPSAHSLEGSRRVFNPKQMNDYASWVRRGCPVTGDNSEILTRSIRYEEAVWLGLRTVEGINPISLSREYGFRPGGQTLKKWEERNCLEQYNEDNYRLEGRGWVLLDEITVDLLR
ncbi:radical SAM family heme chaperone HemW [Fibrobacterota bacterium]